MFVGREGKLYTYTNVGLSALLVSTDRAMREPLLRGTSSRLAPRFRFCISRIEYFKSCLGGDRGLSYQQKPKFMKKIFFFLLGLLSSCSLWAETVHVETPGTLKELLMDLEFTGTQLTLTGTLNAADLSFIHDGKGRMENVEELDISQIKVMPSDESYANGSVSYVAGDNFLPKAYFYYSTECYCDTTRTTDMLGRGHVTYKIHDNNLAGLFLDNASYKKVILPSWLKTIGKYMFQDSNIENCVFPEVYKEIDDLFGLGDLYDGVFLEIYLRMNRIDDAADCLERYVNVLTGEKVMPKEYLFSPGLELKKMERSYPKDICKVLLKALEDDEQYKILINNPKCKRAIEKLKAIN